MLLTGVSADIAVGRGAGADDVTLQIKREIVTAAVARLARESDAAAMRGVDDSSLPNQREIASAAVAGVSRDVDAATVRGELDDVRPRHGVPANAIRGSRVDDLRSAIEALAGFEIVAMAGFFAAGARLGATLLLDGYVATSAVLIADHLHPGTAHSMIAAHRSAEPGHAAALAKLGLDPLLDWNMRLGEGTGALIALPLLDSASVLLRDVAALSDLGVARED
jgi:nicotinate-nucleotide--dimethylbenzimidazole phosphoribosyltransferase